MNYDEVMAYPKGTRISEGNYPSVRVVVDVGRYRVMSEIIVWGKTLSRTWCVCDRHAEFPVDRIPLAGKKKHRLFSPRVSRVKKMPFSLEECRVVLQEASKDLEDLGEGSIMYAIRTAGNSVASFRGGTTGLGH